MFSTMFDLITVDYIMLEYARIMPVFKNYGSFS